LSLGGLLLDYAGAIFLLSLCLAGYKVWKRFLFPEVCKEDTRLDETKEEQSHLSTSADAERPFLGVASQIRATPFAILNLSQRNHHYWDYILYKIQI